MFGIFSSKYRSIECLHCARMMRVAVNARTCECGQKPIPPDYLKKYKEVRPLYFPVIGWSRIGKTVWMYSLIRRLQEMAPSIWPDFTISPLDPVSDAFLPEVLHLKKQKEGPRGNPIDLQETYLFMLENMPRWNSRTLILKDLAGEPWSKGWFDKNWDTPNAVQYRQLLTNNKTAMMFFSLANMDQSETNGDGQTMEQMLNRYRLVLENQGVADISREQRRILVVLTQGGRISKLDQNIFEYLDSDPISRRLDPGRYGSPGAQATFDNAGMAEYFAVMKQVSNQLKEWVRDHGGAQFLNQCKRMNISVEFCITSCFEKTVKRQFEAAAPLDAIDVEKVEDVWHCQRALDPLFWALELQSATKVSGRT